MSKEESNKFQGGDPKNLEDAAPELQKAAEIAESVGRGIDDQCRKLFDAVGHVDVENAISAFSKLVSSNLAGVGVETKALKEVATMQAAQLRKV